MLLRILHVIPQLGVGGTERVVADLTRFQQERCLTRLCILGSAPARMPDFNFVANIKFLGYSGSFRNLSGTWTCIRRLRQEILRFRPHIVHAHLWPAAAISAAAVARISVHHFSHIHDSRPWLASHSPRNRIQKAIYRMLLRSVDSYLIAVSEAVAEYTMKNLTWPRDRIRVVHNGIDTRGSVVPATTAADKPRNGHVVIGAIGRVTKEKGIDVLVEAAAILKRRGVHFKLLIAGHNSGKNEFYDLAVSLEVSANIEFLGAIDDVDRFYSALDIFTLPSRSEGMPISILEAMAMQLPIVASNIAGVPQILREGREGLLVPPGDARSLAKAIERLCNDDELRQRMGERGHERVRRHFTASMMADGVMRTYRELLSPQR